MYDDTYLYLLMRNDLDSMNGGKAVAHGAHAANQFMYDMERRIDADLEPEEDLIDAYKAWVTSAKGFGTTITLTMNLRELQTVVAVSQSMGFLSDATVDPTYPYILHKEYANLIDHKSMVTPETLASEVAKGTMNPDNAPSPMGKGGMMLCLRDEVTCGFVFGSKSRLKPIIGNFPLMP